MDSELLKHYEHLLNVQDLPEEERGRVLQKLQTLFIGTLVVKLHDVLKSEEREELRSLSDKLLSADELRDKTLALLEKLPDHGVSLYKETIDEIMETLHKH